MAEDRPPFTIECVEQAASHLRADEHEALLLGARERLASSEIAERLGISAREAEALVARALLKLERALRRRERPWWRFW